MTKEQERDNWDRARAILDRDWRLLIDGELSAAAGDRRFDVTSPVDGSVIASIPDASADDVDRAVGSAAAAFPAWRDLEPAARADVVRRIADVVEAHGEDLALLDAVDGGAPVAVMDLDVRWAAWFCRYMAGLALEAKGYTVPSASVAHLTIRQPFGVVAKIIPFNHPIMFAVSKLAAPLVAGNTVVLKPAEATPLSALYLAELLRDVVPRGVVQILVGNGPDVPRALVRHPDVHRIGFTGSEPTGRAILKDAADVGVKEVSLELGGKNALIAFPDADPAEVAAGAVRGMNFTWSGQSCGSTSRLILHDDIADAVLAEIRALLSRHRVGSPLDPDNDQGSIVNENQYRRITSFVEGAREDGAEVLTGGSRPEGLEGLYYAPTVLDRVDPSWRVANEEVFGPVLSVIRWHDGIDPVAIANSVKYGLTGSVYTNDVRVAMRTARALETGYVWINKTAVHYDGMPFGGWKSSGNGREESLEELLSYTETKSINIPL